ncbi:hypothetical protein EMIT0158MI4_130093 [Burkholderia ambifaria]
MSLRFARQPGVKFCQAERYLSDFRLKSRERLAVAMADRLCATDGTVEPERDNENGYQTVRTRGPEVARPLRGDQ